VSADDENVVGSFRASLFAHNVGKCFALGFKALPKRSVAGIGQGRLDVRGCSAEGGVVVDVSEPNPDGKVMNGDLQAFLRTFCSQGRGQNHSLQMLRSSKWLGDRR